MDGFKNTRKLVCVIPYELAFQEGEIANCLTHFLKEGQLHDEVARYRVECISVFSKAFQGGKRYVRNTDNEHFGINGGTKFLS